MGKHLGVILFFRKSSSGKLFAFTLALYLLNISVDFQDSRSPVSQEILSVNEIESLAELVIEEIADVEDFFDEQHEAEREPISKAGASLVYILSTQLSVPHKELVDLINPSARYFSYHYSATLSKLTPPPKAV